MGVALKALLALNWYIEYESNDAREMQQSSDTCDVYSYNPQPVDMTNLTLSRLVPLIIY